MNYADIAIIVIMVLSVLLGVWKGFWKTFSKALTLIIALAIGFLLATQLAPMIFPEAIEGPINDLVSKVIINNDASNGVIMEMGNDWFVMLESGEAIEVDNALGDMLIPKFLQDPIISSMDALTIEQLASGVTMHMVVSSAYTHLFESFLAGMLIFLASLIVLRVIAKLIYNAINHKHFLRGIDRIFGGVFRLVTGFLSVVIILHIFSVLSGISALQPVIEVIEDGTISGPLFDAGILNKIFYGDSLKQLTDLFENLIISLPSTEESAMVLVKSIIR